MNETHRDSRDEQLVAGRVLGDLDAAEYADWLAVQPARGSDEALDLEQLAAEIEAAYVLRNPTPLPAALAVRLGEQARRAAAAPATPALALMPMPAAPHRPVAPFFGRSWVGWAVAAALLGLLVADRLVEPAAPSHAAARLALLDRAADSVVLEFVGTGDDFPAAAGDVVWSDANQAGFMQLANLPPNDPAERQYQLWIVDPARDEFPVDGGVFDIPAGVDQVIVPVHAKLPVQQPAAFVITLEQPGGVVRSKQEVVVAIAKPA